MSEDWVRAEIQATVEDYFAMLEAELSGLPINKTEHRNGLMKRLRGRTPSAVERKHQNISAILRDEALPFVDGYKPLSNYQRALRDEVDRFLVVHPDFGRLIDRVEGEVPAQVLVPMDDPANLFVDAPEHEDVARPPRAVNSRQVGFYDFELRDERMRRLGNAGEEFVFHLEQTRLEREGRPELAKRVEWISETRGDGAGVDVLSFDAKGQERFVEVKTTNFGRRHPFLISRNELDFADENESQFLLYRVFPRLYSLPGSVRKNCSLDAVIYEGRP